MKYIKIGNIEVPVWPEEYQIDSNVSQNPSIPIPSRFECFEHGVTIGTAIETIGNSSNSCSIGGGRTPLHDDSELVVSNYYDYPAAGGTEGSYAKRVDWLISRVEGESTIEVTSGYQQPMGFVGPLVGTDRTTIYEYRWVAVPYRFIRETLPDKRKVLNYKIVCRYKSTTRYHSSGEERIQYWDGGNPINLNFAWWNEGDRFMYLDPEDKPEDEDPNDEDEPSDEDGGDGDHEPLYEPVPIPDMPSMGAANAGFITMYKLGLSAINVFASDMFASNVWEAIRLFFSNPIDFLVGCMLLPFEPETGSSYHPKFGAIAFEHAYPAVSNQYKDIDCGSIAINKYWGSAFDYEPYTKIQIWLPYIGYRDLPVDEIMGMTINVKYRVDCLTGDCVAFVSTGVVGQIGPQIPRVIAQFYGNCGVRVPFGSVSFDAAVAASINLVGAAASMGLNSGAGSVMQGSEGGVAVDEGFSSPSSAGLVNAAIGVVSSMKPNVQKGGAAGASTGYMSIQKPYLIRRIPRQNLPSNYMSLKGYPSNIGGKLSDFTGLAIVDDIQLNNIPAMEEERKEIMKWLTGGVLI